MAKVTWTGRAVKDLRKLPARDQSAVRVKVNKLQGYPDIHSLDVKKLTDQNGKYRLRIKNYRVLFDLMNEDEALVIEIQCVLRRSSTTY